MTSVLGSFSSSQKVIDYPHGKMFKQTVSQAQKLKVTCNVGDGRGSRVPTAQRQFQTYGFYLRELQGKTHGRYIEVGDRPKRIAFVESMLGLSQIHKNGFARRCRHSRITALFGKRSLSGPYPEIPLSRG